MADELPDLSSEEVEHRIHRYVREQLEATVVPFDGQQNSETLIRGVQRTIKQTLDEMQTSGPINEPTVWARADPADPTLIRFLIFTPAEVALGRYTAFDQQLRRQLHITQLHDTDQLVLLQDGRWIDPWDEQFTVHYDPPGWIRIQLNPNAGIRSTMLRAVGIANVPKVPLDLGHGMTRIMTTEIRQGQWDLARDVIGKVVWYRAQWDPRQRIRAHLSAILY